ncbi:MAG: hypothetical protein WD403_08525 [Pirellulales bacterium]
MQTEVHFVGGPFDGFEQAVVLSSSGLPATVAFPISRGVFRIMEGRARGRKSPTTSVAVYRRARTASDCRYYFLGSILPEKLRIEG